MRITGGHAKGKILSSFKGLNIRPTSDHVREAIFSILGQDFTGKRVMDLFAGTGVLGLEAISRGANSAVFVEISSQAIALIRKNIQMCGFTDRATVLKKDLRKALPSLDSMGGLPFDVVFVDPPYRQGLVPQSLARLVQKRVLADNAIVLAETYKTEELVREVSGLLLVDCRTYGDTKINFYKWRRSNDKMPSHISGDI